MPNPVGSGFDAVKKLRNFEKNSKETELNQQIDTITLETLNYMKNGDLSALDRAQMNFMEYLARSESEERGGNMDV